MASGPIDGLSTRGNSQNAADVIYVLGNDNVDYKQTIAFVFAYVPGDIRLLQGSNRTFGVRQSTSGAGDNLTVEAGDGEANTDVNGGDLFLYSGTGQTAGGGGSGHGGDVIVASGDGAGTAGNGGDVFIYGGKLAGAGTAGNVYLAHTGGAPNGNVGVGTEGADRRLEVNTGAAAGGIRISYNAGAGSATDYAELVVGSNGDLSITTVDSDGASGDLKLNLDGNLSFVDGVNMVFNTVTGTKIGTATDQKLGFYNATPVVQQAHIVDANGTLADITTKFNTLLSQIEALGLLATA
jgi:hypothetical protein